MTRPLGLAIAWGAIGPALVLALAPLLDGIARRVRARLESRQGPPWLQGYLDLAKLLEKHEVSAATSALATTMPWIGLGAAVCAALLLPVGGATPLGFAGDGLVVLYLLALSSVALALAGSASTSPFGALGAGREMLLVFLVEPIVACALFVAGIHTGTFALADAVAWHARHGPGVSGVLASAGLLAALLAYMGKLPFDLPEADQELMGGSTLEFGGRRLALLRWTLFVRWLVVTWLAAEVFLPTPLPGWIAVPLTPLKVLALFTLASAASALVTRLRVDRARALMWQVTLLMGFAIVFALVGA